MNAKQWATEEEMITDEWLKELIKKAQNKPDSLLALLLELFHLDAAGFNDNKSLAELLELENLAGHR